MAHQALVHDHHEYQPGKKHISDDGSDAAPTCKVCGAAETAYIHLDEAGDTGYTLVQIQHEDSAVASEHTAKR